MWLREHMNPEEILAAGIILVTLAAAAWDVWAAYHGNGHRSVSSIMHSWSTQFPVLPFVLGLVAGHLLWPTWRKP